MLVHCDVTDGRVPSTRNDLGERPLLEYNTVVWLPQLKGDIHTIENVQRRFTKRLPGCSTLTCAERRIKLCLLTL